MVAPTQPDDPTDAAAPLGPTNSRGVPRSEGSPARRTTDSEEFPEMSTITAPRPTHAQPSRPAHSTPATTDAAQDAIAVPPPARHVEPRGFALYVGLDEA